MSFKKKDTGKRPKESKKKEGIIVRAETNNRKDKDTIQSTNKSNKHFFEKTNKNVNPLAKLIKYKRVQKITAKMKRDHTTDRAEN